MHNFVHMAWKKTRINTRFSRKGGSLAALTTPTPTAAVLSADRIRLARPSVEGLRLELFGAPGPPYSSKDDPDLTALMGVWLEDEFDGRENSTRSIMESATKEIARATGFDESDVQGWILAGEEPKLKRASISVVNLKGSLPDGTKYRRREAHMVFHDRLEDREVRRIARRLGRVWGTKIRDVPLETGGSRASGRASKKDAHLERIMERLPEGSAWKDVQNLWRKTPMDGWSKEKWTAEGGPGTVQANSLRLRWDRLQKKISDRTPRDTNKEG